MKHSLILILILLNTACGKLQSAQVAENEGAESHAASPAASATAVSTTTARSTSPAPVVVNTVTASPAAASTTAASAPAVSTTAAARTTTTAPVAAAVANSDPATCTSYSTSDQDALALADIGRMDKVQCRLKAKILGDFYTATKNMSDTQRRDHFDRQIAGLSPPPPPPPAPCSVIVKALLDCAK